NRWARTNEHQRQRQHGDRPRGNAGCASGAAVLRAPGGDHGFRARRSRDRRIQGAARRVRGRRPPHLPARTVGGRRGASGGGDLRMTVRPIEFGEMRPRLRLLMELYRNAATEEARATLLALCEDVFLAAAWNVAVDLLDNGWQPTITRLDEPKAQA